jgi:hypothetical protein
MVLPPEPPAPSSRERKGIFSRGKEKPPAVEEIPKSPEIPEAVERVGVTTGQVNLPQPVTDDAGAVVLDDATPKQVTITLPLTEKEIESALALKVVYSFRWLAEWTKRLLKKAGGKFVYRRAGK